ncbi:hypothetical protein MPSEU_000943600 [Mayamaea pseudoterrestris]|nr:hypothetical protein MPSEU_000943600 [Mayamaea pseudoterrestris]
MALALGSLQRFHAMKSFVPISYLRPLRLHENETPGSMPFIVRAESSKQRGDAMQNRLLASIHPIHPSPTTIECSVDDAVARSECTKSVHSAPPARHLRATWHGSAFN